MNEKVPTGLSNFVISVRSVETYQGEKNVWIGT